VVVDEKTVADTPLNLTVLEAGVALKPVPSMPIESPACPKIGAMSEMATAVPELRLIEVIFPAASYVYCALLPEASMTSVSRPAASYRN